jgi:hypothetical protein
MATTSPRPTNIIQEETFDFPEAIRCITFGMKVTKLEWADPEYFLQLVDTHLKIHKPDGKFYDLIITDGDLVGEDYKVIE